MQDILSPLIDACQWILEFWHDLVGGSWGWSIILLTFTVRIVILPLTFKGVKSMQRLQTLQPEIKKIQQRFKDDKQRQQQEVMKFYAEHKINPLASCLPLIAQLPFFIGLFYLLQTDLRNEICGQSAKPCGQIPGDNGEGFLFVRRERDVARQAEHLEELNGLVVNVGED